MKRDVVVIGGSAGSIHALQALVSALPALPEVSILVVVHMPATSRSVLPRILSRCGPLSAVHAVDGAHLLRGGILVAPPDRHLMVRGDRVVLSRGPRENSHRPAIDVLFRTAARSWGRRVVGVVLSGVLDDGTAGMAAVKMHGGLTLAQSPDDALYSAMPQSVIDHVVVDHVASAAGLAPLLLAALAEELPVLPDEATGQEAADPQAAPAEAEAIRGSMADETEGPVSGYTCPDCHGALWELRDGTLRRYRCRTGHTFSPESLLASQDESVEEAMWAAFRALEESASLARRMAERARERHHEDLARRYDQRERDAIARAEMIRRALEDRIDPALPPTTPSSPPDA